MINNIHYEEALNNILIVVIAAAVVLVLVMLLGSKKSRFRKKLSAFFADDTVGTAKHPMEFNREYYITGEACQDEGGNPNRNGHAGAKSR